MSKKVKKLEARIKVLESWMACLENRQPGQPPKGMRAGTEGKPYTKEKLLGRAF